MALIFLRRLTVLGVLFVCFLLMLDARGSAAQPAAYPLTLSVNGPAFGVSPGQTLSIKLTVKNTGNGEYYKTSVVVFGYRGWLGKLPKNVVEEDGVLRWTILALGKRQTKSLVLKFKAPSNNFGVTAQMWTPILPSVNITSHYIYRER